MKTLEQRMKSLEEMVAEIHARIVMGQAATPGEAEYRRAIDALTEGDVKPLALFKARGGVVPKLEITDKTQMPRKRVERPRAEPTNGCGNPEGANDRSGAASELRSPAPRIHSLPDPVMLPAAKERGATAVNQNV